MTPWVWPARADVAPPPVPLGPVRGEVETDLPPLRPPPSTPWIGVLSFVLGLGLVLALLRRARRGRPPA